MKKPRAKSKKPLSLAGRLASEMTLEELRFQRDLAARNNDFRAAFTLAIAIDKKKGLY